MRLLRAWATVSPVVGLVLLAMVAFGLVFGTRSAEQAALYAVVIALVVWGSNLAVRRVLERFDETWDVSEEAGEHARRRNAARPGASTGDDDAERAA